MCLSIVILVEVRMSLSSLSSSSFGKCTLAPPLCFCEVQAILRYSNTKENPERPFLGCPKYNTKGLPYCKYFKWADIELQEYANELLRKEEELEKRLFNVEIQVTELCKIVDEIKKREMELVLLERESVLRHSRTLSWVYFDLFLVVCCYLLTS
ncbi:hypothetical protein F2P56_014705 [Juglans regia]|uniref:GRF-type domain-containing protein n=1 Tax=Juglans regia TaxID=51240 RepID=A0A833XEH7_JUGRE|nr:hypothetical protein F2P56_014705 [Juglans regia]